MRSIDGGADPDQKDLIDACLDNFRSKGEKRIHWEATIKNWCRKHKEWNPKNYESEGGITVDDSGLKFNTIEERPRISMACIYGIDTPRIIPRDFP